MRFCRIRNRREVAEKNFLAAERPRDAILDDNAHFVAVGGLVLFTSEVIGSVTGCENAGDGLRSCTSSEAFRFGGGGMRISSVALSPPSRTINAFRNQQCTAEIRKRGQTRLIR